jgi:hypothetical protein
MPIHVAIQLERHRHGVGDDVQLNRREWQNHLQKTHRGIVQITADPRHDGAFYNASCII